MEHQTMVEQKGDFTYLAINEADTYRWANRPGAKWPCSYLSGHLLEAHFQGPDLVWYAVDGMEDFYVPVDEFDAITTDHLPAGHPARRGVA